MKYTDRTGTGSRLILWIRSVTLDGLIRKLNLGIIFAFQIYSYTYIQRDIYVSMFKTKRNLDHISGQKKGQKSRTKRSSYFSVNLVIDIHCTLILIGNGEYDEWLGSRREPLGILVPIDPRGGGDSGLILSGSDLQ